MRLGDVAACVGGRLLGDATSEVSGLEPLYRAGPKDLAIAFWAKDIKLAKYTRAQAVIMPTSWAAQHADQCEAAIIAVEDVALVFSKLAEIINAGYLRSYKLVAQKNVSACAEVSVQAHLSRAYIGSHTRIHPNVVIGDDVVIGAHCEIGPGVIIYDKTYIGDYVHIGAHTVIGSPAFAPPFSSLGYVNIHDHVSIGALCTVDRGLISMTEIMRSCALDNHVHIGHDVKLGPEVIIAGQSGLAGFVQVGQKASLGGQVGVAPQVIIGAHARISGKTMVHRDVKAFAICSGNPGVPHARYLKIHKENLRKTLDNNYAV
jgi:UDP-3-O-[3-hydroxymyristoyl] glucosamine N-acyltransferase